MAVGVLSLNFEFLKHVKGIITILWININYHFKNLDFFLILIGTGLEGLGPTSVIFCRLYS